VTDSTGERIAVSANAGALRGPRKSLPDISLKDVDILLIDGHHLDALAPLLESAKLAGICLVLDGGSWKPQLETLLPLFDVVIASSNFGPPSCANHTQVLQYLASKGVMRRAITRGERPILAEHDRQHVEVPVPFEKAADTLGAGDIFHGAFCVAYSRRMDNFIEALRLSAEVASLSTTVGGTRAWAAL
jgi:sugar/nucleoside kinase (ribokinase family)